MNTENPFEVSKLCSGVGQADTPFANPFLFRVEGDVLVCGHPVILPRICARGLTSDNLVAKTTLVQFASFRPVLVQRRCSVTYFVNRSSTRRRLVSFVIDCFIAAVVLVIVTFLESLGLAPTGVYILLLLMIAAVLWWKRNPIRLTLVSYEPPGIYRIRGFSQNYLDTISRHVADLPTNIS